MRIMRCAAALIVACWFATTAHAADPTGNWLNEDKDGIIQIGDCGALREQGRSGTLCGMIVWIRDRIDPATGKPPVDKNNADPALRNRTILGLEVLSQMRPSTVPNRWAGRVYNIDDGKTYDGTLTVVSDRELRVEGCVLVVCSGETWTRQGAADPRGRRQQAP